MAEAKMSMTFVVSRRKPWLLVRMPALFRRYGRYISEIERLSETPSVALHKALRDTYRGRLRMRFLGHWPFTHMFAAWLLRPFDQARGEIDCAGDIHAHGRIDVLAYRALAYSKCGQGSMISPDLTLIDQLCEVLHDDARKEHWLKRQRPSIDAVRKRTAK
ncbi:MAG TPA: hypothetical protein VIR57_10245 [Chloroflexota bacterium]